MSKYGLESFPKLLRPELVPFTLGTYISRIMVLSVNREERMAEQCFKMKVTMPPICGVHKVPLKQSQVSIDRNAPGLGQITCLKCPVSQAVALEAQRFQARISR
jgi:hypothetical protein